MSSSMSQILQKHRDCVRGYIKQLLRRVKGIHIPDVVMDIVLSYYHILDQWDKNAIGSKMSYNEANESIVQTVNLYQSAFLSEVVEDDVFKWTFKITGYNFERSGYNYLIGIWKTKSLKGTKDLKETYFSKDFSNMYGWLASCGLKSNNRSSSCSAKYGSRIKNEDIIEMILDLKWKMDLRYTVNGKDCGKAFDVEKTEYRAAVMIAAKNNGIQLLPSS